MRLDPEIAALFTPTDEPPPEPMDVPIDLQRQAMAASAASLPKRPVASVENHVLDGAGGPITLRIYAPESRAPHPLFFFIHGGGWIFGNEDTHDATCRSLCHFSGFAVAAIGYRLAPEHKFPAAVHDCLHAVQWIVDHAKDIDVDPSRLVVGGESAGANLAAVMAAHFPDTFRCQILGYPAVDLRMASPTMAGDEPFPGLTAPQARWCRDHYLASPLDAEHPDASPILLDDLAGLPPAFIMTAEHDPLRDEGELYGHRLIEAGVQVTIRRYLGMPHGFLFLPDSLKCVEQAFTDIANVLHHCTSRAPGI